MRHRINEEIGETGGKFDFNIHHSLKAKRGSDDRDTKLNGSVCVTALLFADDDTEMESVSIRISSRSVNRRQLIYLQPNPKIHRKNYICIVHRFDRRI